MSTLARDFFLARLASARASARGALEALDVIFDLCNAPDDDARGKERMKALEAADELLGQAATSVQLAMEAAPDVDMAEGEPEEYEDEDDEEDEDEDEDDEDDEEPEEDDPGDAQPKRARRKR